MTKYLENHLARTITAKELEKVAGGVAQTPDRWAGEDGKGGCLTNDRTKTR